MDVTMTECDLCHVSLSPVIAALQTRLCKLGQGPLLEGPRNSCILYLLFLEHKCIYTRAVRTSSASAHCIEGLPPSTV